MCVCVCVCVSVAEKRASPPKNVLAEARVAFLNQRERQREKARQVAEELAEQMKRNKMMREKEQVCPGNPILSFLRLCFVNVIGVLSSPLSFPGGRVAAVVGGWI